MLVYKRIICDCPGQLCNRLWSYLDTVSWAVKNNKKVAILFWDENIKYFDRFRNCKYVSFPFYNRAMLTKYGDKWGRFVVRKLHSKKLQSFYSSGIGRKLGFVEGWPLRECDRYYPSVKQEVNQLFTPNDPIKKRVDSLFDSLRRSGKFVVGIHIRRGDYKIWRDGMYFYDHLTYSKWMAQLVALNPDKSVCFYIASNEPVPDDLMQRFDSYTIEHACAVDDLYALSLCDAIIGPPSTFSQWASMMGSVKYRVMKHQEDEILSMDEFSRLVSFSRFEE